MKKKISLLLITAALTVALCTTSYAGRVLYNGTSGDDVYELQELLSWYGYFYDDPTGYFGDITESAVISFQYDNGLVPDGVAGPITSSYLGLSSDIAYDDDNAYGSSDVSFSRTLYYGLEGDDVYRLQELLAAYGYFYGELTGYFGELTESAVINFQYDSGLATDGVAGSMTIGALTGTYQDTSGGSYFNYSDAVLDAIERTPSTGAGYCAAWVTQVFQNAGILTYNINDLRPTYYSYAATSGLADSWYSDNAGFNANDYWAYVCYSSDFDDLQPGMIVATRSSYSYLGRQFGHVGIYIGNGKVISSIGYLETLTLDEWNSKYNNTAMGSSICWGYLPY